MELLSFEQRQGLYRDGYLVVRNAVAPELVQAALDRIHSDAPSNELGTDSAMTDLVNRSTITPILN